MDSHKKQVPIKKGLWSESGEDGRPHLLVSECKNCGELFFPVASERICANCQNEEFNVIPLGLYGEIYSFSVVMVRPPEFYKGEVPYALGTIEMPEGIRIVSLLTRCDFDSLKVGMNVELVLEPLYVNEEGEEVICYKFKPVNN